nr:uncharacterized protein LOC122271747 [Parasteatoda tepidariorum]
MSEGFNESENRMVSPQNLQQSSVEKKRKSSEFRRYLKQVFEDSLMTGFSQIATSRTWKKAIPKAAILIFCFLGFTYQTCDFLHYYFQYPVTVNVEESSPFEMTPPAFTFCNNNM